MKKLPVFIPLLTILVVCEYSFSSCRKYLTVEPQSAFPEEYVFGSVNDAYRAVLGVYNRMAGDQGWGSRLNYFYATDTDEMLGSQNYSPGGGDNGTKEIARYNASPTNTQLAPVYNQLYQGIERANICIKHIPQMELYKNGSSTEQAELQRLYGEALTLRAEFYFDLIKNWGDVPASFVPAIDLADLNLPKTDRDSIYDHILADLELAGTLVPWRGTAGVAEDERITRGAVKGLRARIALFRGGYSLRKSKKMERRADYLDYYRIARDECKLIMESEKHHLNPSYLAVFKDNLNAHRIEPNGEVMFEVALAGGVSNTDGRLGFFDGVRVNGKSSPQMFLLPTYFYSFDSSDLRRDVTTATYNIDGNGNVIGYSNPITLGTMFAKFRRDWMTNPAVSTTSDAQYFGVNWPLLRYSDVLLMFAEAENELNNNPTPEAIEAFTKVRLRGFGGNAAKMGNIPTTKAAFFSAIVSERSFELGGEAVRKYDLIRWDSLSAKITQARINLDKMRLKQPPYNLLPAKMYYRNNSPALVWYGSYYTPAVAATPQGYTAINWVANLNPSFIQMVAERFVPNFKELLPLPQDALTSNTALSQDYGY